MPNPSARLTSQHSPTLAYTRLHSPAIARASLATRACLPAMAIHPMNPMHPHAPSCIACIRMHLHVSTCPTRVPSVRPPSRHKAPGVQHPSGPHAIRSSELDCCQSYSTPPSKQVRASRRTAFEFLHHPSIPPGIVLAQWHTPHPHGTRHHRHRRPLTAFPLGRLPVLMYPPLPFRRIFLLVFFPFSIFPLRFSS